MEWPKSLNECHWDFWATVITRRGPWTCQPLHKENCKPWTKACMTCLNFKISAMMSWEVCILLHLQASKCPPLSEEEKIRHCCQKKPSKCLVSRLKETGGWWTNAFIRSLSVWSRWDSQWRTLWAVYPTSTCTCKQWWYSSERSKELRYKSPRNKVQELYSTTHTQLLTQSDCCLLQGTIMLNTCTSPLGSQHTFFDYAHVLMKWFIIPQFSKGTREVHIILMVQEGLSKTQSSSTKQGEALQPL